jgi:multiple sugar transport system substrate-binding protein
VTPGRARGGERAELRGLCWDHPRCTRPMAAAAAEWHRRRGVAVRWAARPLAAFNDQPIAEAAAGYDLVFVDHPMMGETAPTGCLAPLDELIPPPVLAALAADSIGGSHDTYAYAGRQWALAVDAACQVAVASEPGLARIGATAPVTWDEVIDLARRHPGAVAIPLYPSDALCALLSMGDAGDEPFAAVETLAELAAVADPRSFDLNPPALLDLMSGYADPGEVPAYAPLVFGYSGYQRPGAPGRRLRFLDAPAPGGGVLGGAGLAVTAAAGDPEEAAAFAAWIAGAEAQRDVVCAQHGQPASASVWADPAADRLVGGFFSATRATIERARVRPREPWWPRFAEEAGITLARRLRERANPRALHAELTAILHRHREKENAR